MVKVCGYNGVRKIAEGEMYMEDSNTPRCRMDMEKIIADDGSNSGSDLCQGRGRETLLCSLTLG